LDPKLREKTFYDAPYLPLMSLKKIDQFFLNDEKLRFPNFCFHSACCHLRIEKKQEKSNSPSLTRKKKIDDNWKVEKKTSMIFQNHFI
jgi:hypothetical protein